MNRQARFEAAVIAGFGVATTLFVGAVLCAIFGSWLVILLALAVGMVTAIFWRVLREPADVDDD